MIASYMLFGFGFPAISAMQSFAHTNNCKSYFDFDFWSAIIHMYEQLQVVFYFWECPGSHV